MLYSSTLPIVIQPMPPSSEWPDTSNLCQCLSFTLIGLLCVFISDRPYAQRFNPASRKFNVEIGKPVYISFDYDANPPASSVTNWTFINSSGIPEDLPTNSYTDLSYSSYKYLSFILNSSAYYGNYSVMMTNSIGSTIITFQVVPEGESSRNSKKMQLSILPGKGSDSSAVLRSLGNFGGSRLS